jgi:hypothetical protein
MVMVPSGRSRQTEALSGGNKSSWPPTASPAHYTQVLPAQTSCYRLEAKSRPFTQRQTPQRTSSSAAALPTRTCTAATTTSSSVLQETLARATSSTAAARISPPRGRRTSPTTRSSMRILPRTCMVLGGLCTGTRIGVKQRRLSRTGRASRAILRTACRLSAGCPMRRVCGQLCA